MPKHILDHPKTSAGGEMLHRFAQVERETGVKGPHPATASLQRRAKPHAAGNARVRAYTRIERTQS